MATGAAGSGDKSSVELTRDAARDLVDLAGTEAALAGNELRADVAKLARASLSLSVALGAGLVALQFGLVAAVAAARKRTVLRLGIPLGLGAVAAAFATVGVRGLPRGLLVRTRARTASHVRHIKEQLA
jgi:hypothetical protein